MAFGDFSFPQVQRDLGLTLDEADLFHSVEPLTVPRSFKANLSLGRRWAWRSTPRRRVPNS